MHNESRNAVGRTGIIWRMRTDSHPWVLALVGFLGLTLMTGCSGVNKPIAGRADPYAPGQINFADAGLANMTAVGTPIVEPRNGLLYVTVPIRSTEYGNWRIDYRITFLNDHGAPIEQYGWTGGTTLESNTPSYIKFNSTSANARDFQLDLRWSR